MLGLTDSNPTGKLLSVSASPEYSLKLLSHLTAPKKVGHCGYYSHPFAPATESNAEELSYNIPYVAYNIYFMTYFQDIINFKIQN